MRSTRARTKLDGRRSPLPVLLDVGREVAQLLGSDPQSLGRLRANRRNDFAVQIRDQFLRVSLDFFAGLGDLLVQVRSGFVNFRLHIAKRFLDLAAELFHRMTSRETEDSLQRGGATGDASGDFAF